jgi:hypothetical protein
MAYSYRLFGSIDEVDLGAWERVRSECGASIVMDPRFVGAVESSMKQNCQFWYVIVYEDNNRPVACACLSGMTIDLADFADTRMAWLIQHLPRMLSPLRQLKVLICGLPVSTAHNTLGLTTRSASHQILPIIDSVICQLASKTRTHGVLYREFRQDDLEWTSPLRNLGYQRIAGPPMYFFKPSFQDLQHYCAALKSHYRKQIKRSIRKLERMGVETKILTDPEQILKAYTPEVHTLYYQVREKAEIKFETLTVEYLRELASRLDGQVNLILFAVGSRVIAFGWCLQTNSAYYMLYAGLDYSLNDELDLYFNLHYVALDCALRKRVSSIELGATGDAFKARLGCYSEPSYFFAKGHGPLMSLVVRGANLLVPQKPAVPAFDIFNSDYVASVK